MEAELWGSVATGFGLCLALPIPSLPNLAAARMPRALLVPGGTLYASTLLQHCGAPVIIIQLIPSPHTCSYNT